MAISTSRNCIYYRYASSTALDVDPDCRAWLSARELQELAGWRNPQRRMAWLRGRLLAKQLIATLLEGPAEQARIEILSRDANNRSSRPEVWCAGMRQSIVLSLSHTDSGVLAAMALDDGCALGVDVTSCQELPTSVVKTWFTPAEQAWVARDDSGGIASMIWAAKEAIYKACNRGEAFAPRTVEILPNGHITYRGSVRPELRLKSWELDQHIVAVASNAKSFELQLIPENWTRDLGGCHD